MIVDGIERRTFAVLAANRDIAAALWDLAQGVAEGWSRPGRYDRQ